jgi:hypothetical protein
MSRSPSRPRPERGGRLPVGILRGRRRERSFTFAPPAADAALLALDFAQTREALISDALAAALERIGSVERPGAAFVHALTLADRHALVREALIASGCPTVDAVALCGGCSNRLELAFDLRDVVLPNVDPRTIAVRLPTAADVERARDELDLLAALLCCGRRAAKRARERTEDLLGCADPLGTIVVASACPECGALVHAGVDLAGTWLDTLRRRTWKLLDDVHVLASRYHWSERDILDLPAARRLAYLSMCEDGAA